VSTGAIFASAMSGASIVGWYDLSWSGGTFPVCFRPGGHFFCPKFQAPARWTIEGDEVKVDWAKFGKYEFKFDAESKSMEGNAMPKTDDDKNWRKAAFKAPLSPSELAVLGDGAGTEWKFVWSGGDFPVKFKADGYNHFVCDDFPAHAHWSMDGDKIKIVWGEFGTYELTIDAEKKEMDGCAVGGDPATEWRKASHLRNLVGNNTIEHCEHH